MHRALLVSLAASALCLGASDPSDTQPQQPKRTCSRAHEHAFGGAVQVLIPTKELGTALDDRTGLGMGLQWLHEGESPWSSRTRLEWNVFPQSRPVGPSGIETSVQQYLLGFDRLYRLGTSPQSLYLLGGVAATRWFVEEEGPGMHHRFHTTKLTVTGGLGWRFSKAFALEGRYTLSRITNAQEANTAQLSLNWRF